ncbi:acetyl-CoA carboxylase biotin carboxyl carrier protein subunit [uncultured Croceitalea sp.]|uniref:acetyl-CoA carboxylase biotin carboxyl carrier protein subunit n=1 Tax=uncultured Croceitalea sp. TaxID=1798908 RepID=UPI003305DADC
MGNLHKLKVNGQYEFQLSESELSGLNLAQTGPSSFHLLDGSQSYHIAIVQQNYEAKTYTVKVNNSLHTVSIETPLDTLIESMGFALNAASQVSTIDAPMPGLILEVSVSEGQQVKEGDQLLILEAMKMENVITSPRDGVIKNIDASQGQAVEKKHTLITFE